MKIVLVNSESHISIHGSFKKGEITEVSEEAGKYLLSARNEYDAVYFLSESAALKRDGAPKMLENGTQSNKPTIITTTKVIPESPTEPTIQHLNGGTDPEAVVEPVVEEVTDSAEATPVNIPPKKNKGRAVEV